MKLRQRLAAVIAAAILAAAMPTFAASTNGVNKIITVAKDDVLTLENGMAPELRIELKDDLDKGQTFYLNINDAKWVEDADDILNKDSRYNKAFEYTLSNDNKQMEVKAKEDAKASKDAYRIPMLVKVTGNKASVEIDSNDTVVTEGKYEFALASSELAKVSVSEAKSFASAGKVAKITLEESHLNAFKSDKKQVITLDIEESGFVFDLTDKQLSSILVGKKAYQGKVFAGKLINDTTLEVEIPANALGAVQKGALEFEDIQIRAKRDAKYGDVNIVVSGDLNENEKVLVAKYGDYDTILTVNKEYKAVSGNKIENVEFTLSEIVADSFNSNRETDFIFTDGVSIDNIEITKVEGLKAGSKNPEVVVKKDNKKNTNEFVLKSFNKDNNKKVSITFKATIDVPSTFNKDIELVAEGRSIGEAKKVNIAKVEQAVKVEVEKTNLKVGFANQQGGKITLIENSKGNIKEGKIFIATGSTDVTYKEAPKVAVTKGNLKIDDKVEIIPGGLAVTVIRKSSEPSTIVIDGGELAVSGLAAQGTQKVQIGGPALSSYSDQELWNKSKDQYNNIDPVANVDFLVVGNVANKSVFVIGESKYLVNGIEKTMDTESYLSKEGRTMLPVRYVSDALGIEPHQILWDGDSKTVTLLADANNIVQISLGSKDMIINGVKTIMSTAPEVKDGRVFIPVAEIARALRANVNWDPLTKIATFN